MTEAFYKRYPDCELTNVVDDGILREVIANENEVTPGVRRKLVELGKTAELSGAEAVVCMCTTIAGAAAFADQTMNIPFLTIDGPMLLEAAGKGKRIAVLITAETTRKASAASMQRALEKAGNKAARFDMILVEDAWNALNLRQDKKTHDALIEAAAREAAKDHDVLVLAQATMSDVAEKLSDLALPVLTSVESGIAQLDAYLL